MGTLSWDDIPSLENAGVDWEYEPENPLGKRSYLRLGNKQLSLFFNKKSLPVNISSSKLYETGDLLDISQSGLAVLLNSTELKNGSQTKISLHLDAKRVISKAVVRNICSYEGRNRVGLEFVAPAKADSDFIKELVRSQAYCL